MSNQTISKRKTKPWNTDLDKLQVFQITLDHLAADKIELCSLRTKIYEDDAQLWKDLFQEFFPLCTELPPDNGTINLKIPH